MSRLFDRIRAEGARPLRGGDLIEPFRHHLSAFVQARAAEGLESRSEAEAVRATFAAMNAIRTNDGLRAGDLPVMPVVVADNVGHYFAQCPPGTNIRAVVSTLLPPFREMFVDIQGAPNDLGMKTWGVHVRVIHDSEDPNPNEPDDAWVIEAILFAEWRTGEPVGPVGRYLIPLDPEGQARPGDNDGYGSLFGGVVELPGMPDDAREECHQRLLRPLAAALPLFHSCTARTLML